MDKLEAVNEILRLSGLGTVPALDTGKASWTAEAERCLDRSEIDLQSDGWPHDKRVNITLTPIVVTFSNAGWTASSRTLSQAGKFSDATAGMKLTVTDANGGVEDDYIVEQVVSGDAVILTTSLNGTDIASGIEGYSLTNQIKVPAGCLEIDSSGADAGWNITQLGDHLFDVDGNTDQFDSEGVVTDYTLRYKFDCIPYKLQQYIVACATVEFYRGLPGHDPSKLIRLESDRTRAKVRADQFRNDSEDVNVLRTSEARAVTGNRRRYGQPDENFA